MSLIEDIGHMSLECAAHKAENAELRVLLKDANAMLSHWHDAMASMYSPTTTAIMRSPLLRLIEEWQARAEKLLLDPSATNEHALL